MRALLPISLMFLTACAGGGRGQATAFAAQPGQGQYVYPQYLLPTATPRLPEADTCNSLLFTTLVGRHEGTIYFAGLPGRKRVLAPAEREDFDVDRDDVFDPRPARVEVRDYLPGQSVYLPSITTIDDSLRLGPVEQDRLTIELDRAGYVNRVFCG